MGKEKDNPEATDARNDQATDRKKRRWLRWLISVVVLLVVLVFIAPYIAASGPVRRWILSSVNNSIRGKVEIGELSLGWFSAPRIGQIVVQDPDGKEVLSVREVRTEKSLLSLGLSPMHFGRVEVQDPNVRLIASTGGGYSIDKAFESTSPPKPKKPSGKLPDIHGTIVVRGMSIAMTDLTGRRLALTDATSDVDIQSLDKLTGTQTVRLPGGSVVTTKYALTGLAPGGEFQPGNVSGTIEVATDKPADLKPIGEFALPGKGLTGTANLSVNLKFDRGKPDGHFDLALVDVKADKGYAAKVKPVSFAITATAAVDGNAVRGEMHLASQAGGIGKFGGTYSYQTGATPDLSGEKIIAAVLTGEPLHLPPMSLDAKAQIDLAAVAAAVPSLLQLRHDVTVTTGTVALNALTIRGGKSPSIKIAAEMKDVIASRKDANSADRASTIKIKIEPIRADFDSAIEAGTGLNISTLEFDSVCAHLKGSGTPKSFHAQYNANLETAAEEIGKILDLGTWTLAGKINGEAGANMDANQTLGYNIGANIMTLAVGKDDRPAKDDPNALKLDTATFLANGRLTHGRDKDTKLFVDQVRLLAETWLEVDGRAEMNVTSGALAASASIKDAQLAGLWKKAQAMGYTNPKSLAGTLGGQFTVSRKSSADPLAIEGKLTVSQCRIDNKPVSEKDIELALAGVKALGPSVLLAANRISLSSDAATVTMKNLDIHRGEKLAIAGDLDASADLARVAKVADAFRDPNTKPTALAGTLSYSGKAAKTGTDISLTGTGGVAGFRTGSGDKAVKVEPLTFSQDVRINPDSKTVRIQQFTVKSDMLGVTASGTIKDYASTRMLNIPGHYKGDWSKIMAVAHELAPSTADIAITGPLESDFLLAGPMNQPKLTPVYRGMDANTSPGWQTARLLGFELGQTKVPVTFAQGKVVVPKTQIPATGGGTINIGATVDMAPAEPQLHMPGELTVLKEVQINKEVGQKVLSRVNPVFDQLLSLQGRITLVTRDIDVPLGEAIKKRGTGSGHMDLSKLQIEPAGFMGKLLELGGLGGKQLVKVGAVDFVIKDGALKYDNFTMSFGKDFDLRFRGAVRFDDSVDMFVSVPVKAALLKKLGVGGDAKKYAELLDGIRVEIPVLGTRKNPKLDLAKVDVKPLIQKATESLLKKEGGGLFKDLLRGGKSKGDAQPKPEPGAAPADQGGVESPAATQPAEPKVKRKKSGDFLLDGLFNVLDKVVKEQQKKDGQK